MINVGGNHFLTVRAIKQYIDGALGSRGAWLLAPYSDQPHTSGLNTVPLEVIRNPKHPYTRALIGAVPVPDPRTRRAIPNIRGDISKPIDPPPGCRFAPRCPHADASCGERFMELDTADPHLHQAACHKLDVINDG